MSQYSQMLKKANRKKEAKQVGHIAARIMAETRDPANSTWIVDLHNLRAERNHNP
jgi:hypothetical protein